MQWPSKNIPYGGILHPAKNTSFSEDKRQFIKTLIEESKFTSKFQSRKNSDACRSCTDLNSGPHPGRAIGKKTNSLRVISDPCSVRATKRPPNATIQPNQSQRRSRDSILESGAYEIERFKSRFPLPVDRDKEKGRLQKIMSMEEAKDDHKKGNKPRGVRREEEQNDEVAENRFDQLVAEIKEREDWLRQMEKLGEGNKHRVTIEQQIHAKVREMKSLAKM